jgi:hypothetical protein
LYAAALGGGVLAGKADAKDAAASATAASKFVIGILACAMTKRSAVMNALDFDAWQQRGPNKVIIAATCTSSSSLLGHLHYKWDKGAVGAEDAATSATAAAKFIIGIVAHTMPGSSTLLKFGTREVATIWSLY